MNTQKKYSPEVRERAVRRVHEHEREYPSQRAAMESMAGKIGCTAETLRKWVRQAERDQGKRSGLSTSERDRLKELEGENRELKRANEILRKASAFFAQAELDWQAPCADGSDGRVHRRAPGRLRGRADLRSAADRPVGLLRTPSQEGRSGALSASVSQGRGIVAGDQSSASREFRRLWCPEGLVAAAARRTAGGSLYSRAIDALSAITGRSAW